MDSRIVKDARPVLHAVHSLHFHTGVKIALCLEMPNVVVSCMRVMDLYVFEDGGWAWRGKSGVSFTNLGPGLSSARHSPDQDMCRLAVILRKICREPSDVRTGPPPLSRSRLACLEPASSTAMRANDQWHFSGSTTPPSAAQQISLFSAFKFQPQPTDVRLIPEPSTYSDLARAQSLRIVVHRHTPGLTVSR